MTIDRLSGAFLVLVGLFVVWERRVLPLGTTSHPGPGYVPLLLAILLIVFGAILIVRGKGAPAAPFRLLARGAPCGCDFRLLSLYNALLWRRSVIA